MEKNRQKSAWALRHSTDVLQYIQASTMAQTSNSQQLTVICPPQTDFYSRGALTVFMPAQLHWQYSCYLLHKLILPVRVK